MLCRPKNWKSLLAQVRPDKSLLPNRKYRVSMAALGSVTVAIALAIGARVAIILNYISDLQRRGSYRQA